MDGKYKPGERMGIEELAERLGVSTQPIREALVTLGTEGILEVLPHRGFRVAAVHRRDIEHTIRVHAFIAGLLAAEAAAVISPTSIARLREIQAEIERVARMPRDDWQVAVLEDANFNFHRTINLVPEAPRLRWFLRAATHYVPRRDFTNWVDTTVRAHPPIIDALERHDAATARSLVEDHVMKAAPPLIANLVAAGILVEDEDDNNG